MSLLPDLNNIQYLSDNRHVSSQNEIAELRASDVQSTHIPEGGPAELRGSTHQSQISEVEVEPERVIFTDDGELVSDLPDDFDLRTIAETKVRHWSTQVMGELLSELNISPEVRRNKKLTTIKTSS